VFADADLVPLLVQENYINHRPVIASEYRSCEAIAIGYRLCEGTGRRSGRGQSVQSSLVKHSNIVNKAPEVCTST
jgi:hypothetical protein